MPNTERPRFDLQSHSTRSDGALEPRDVVARAAAAGVELLALTDHDTVAGVSEAIHAGPREGIRVVPAIEISAVDPLTGADLHLLGYLIDYDDPVLAQHLAEFRADRERRALAMADGLRAQGLELDEHALAARQEAGRSIGRPHLSQAVLNHPGNQQRLREEGIEEIGGMIRAYMVEGCPAFRPRLTPTVELAMRVVHAAGGVAVWAHPFRGIKDPANVLSAIDRLRKLDLDGVEAFYPSHTREQTELLATRCEALGLLSTGSSDFHGPENRRSSRFLDFETYDLKPNLGPIAD
jgi:predicted metal-dependent phosphoesterase TrpH